MTGVIAGALKTYRGEYVYPLKMRPEDIHPIDIAHALSHICRYNGHVSRFLSVAEHSVRCARRFSLSDPDYKRALLHDASEAYLGDLIAPLKMLPEFDFFLKAEEALEEVICERFDIEMPLVTEAVKEVDIAMRMTEMRDLKAIKSHLDEARFEDEPVPYPFRIAPWSAEAARGEMIYEMERCGIATK